MTQISFSRLWGNQAQRATRDYTPYKTDAEARADRDRAYRDAKRQGFRARRFSISGQCRPYWGFGDPCGHYCTVYYIDVQP